MPCYHPIEVGIRRRSLYCDRGIRDLQIVPCGNCIGCRSEQSRQWAVRMMHESRMHPDNVFITLTYSNDRIPKNGALSTKDFSGFIKRLRKTQERRISFFGCGEYGERTQRPHYHALLFGINFLDRASSFDSRRPMVWRSKALDDLWAMGITEGGSVTMASASYVSGYIRKKAKQSTYVRTDSLTGEILTPEFARMSLRPAIGKRWIEKNWRDVYPRDFIVIDGVEAKPPRYYDKWMDGQHDRSRHCNAGIDCYLHRRMMEQVRQQRFNKAQENIPTKYKMDAGEKIHKARVSLFQGRDAL